MSCADLEQIFLRGLEIIFIPILVLVVSFWVWKKLRLGEPWKEVGNKGLMLVGEEIRGSVFLKVLYSLPLGLVTLGIIFSSFFLDLIIGSYTIPVGCPERLEYIEIKAVIWSIVSLLFFVTTTMVLFTRKGKKSPGPTLVKEEEDDDLLIGPADEEEDNEKNL